MILSLPSALLCGGSKRTALLAALAIAPALAAQTPNARTAANAALEARDYTKAAALLAPLAAANPKDARILYDLGSAQDELDQAAAAEKSYRAAIADDEVYLEPRVALGLLLARNGRFADARGELAAATGISAGDAPLRARAYRTLARIDAKDRPAAARDELLAALQISPETPEDTLLTAELAQNAGGGAGAAEAAYRRVLLTTPNEPDATAGLARLLAQNKHYAEAELYLKKALEAHPGDPGLTVQLASTFAAEGKPAMAWPPVEALAQAHPDDVNIRKLLAGLYIDAGEWAKAEPLLAQITAANPKDVQAIDDRGRALMHLGRFAEAEAVLTRIVAQPALFATPAALGDAAGHLAFAASENMDPAGALRAIQVRATVLPNSPALLFVAAISYDRLHQAKAASEAYRAFLAASNGQNPDQEFEARHRLVTLEHIK
jgi:tetratricopeptide (TPR) repeat protein